MSDDELDPFDLGEIDDDPSMRIVEDDDEDLENQDQRRNLSMAMTQKLYGKQGASTVIDIDNNKYIEARNRFEETLETLDVKIAVDEDTMEKFVVFGGQMNHEDFRQKLEKRMQKDRDLRVLDEFVMACNSDFHFLQVYLSPSKSKLGIQDTILRAFLMIKQSQTRSFAFLLEKLNILAKRTDESDLLLAQTCVAHMRHLNRLFEPLSVFNTMFENPFRNWSPNVREDLVLALPEIFTDINFQQSTALRLNQEILDEKPTVDLGSYQSAIIETLRLLRMDLTVARKIRMTLISLSMQIDVSCLSSLIAFALSSLISPQGVKNDDEELHFHEMLREMSKILKIDVIKKKTSKADSIICEVFSHFLRFLQLDKKGWKHITSWVNRSKADKLISDDESREEQKEAENMREKEKEEEETGGTANWMNNFEIMLILSLLSASDCCPHSFVTAVNSRMLNIPSVASTKFLKLVDLVISFKKFASAHLNALIHIGRQFLWSPDANIRIIGVNLWKHLFVGMERKDRAKVFNELMKHFSQSELECESVLDVFFKVIKNHVTVIMEFSPRIQQCIEHIHNLSISNIKRLFQVLLLISAAGKGSGKKCEIDEIINRFLISVSEREKFLGILALLMKIQVEMNKKHTENQEVNIRAGIERIEGAVKDSANLRGAFFIHMRIVVENHQRLEEVRFISEWTDVLMTRFKNDFFKEFSEETMEEGTSEKMILDSKTENLPEVVPMFNLIKELLVLRMRWREEDDDAVPSSYDVSVIKDLNFAFESLISLDSEGTSKDAKLNHLYFLVQWTRTVLNAFLAQSSTDFLSSEDVSKLATKMFYLMMDSEKKLQASLAGVALWKVPNLKFEKKEDVIVGTVEKKAGRGRAKKRKSDEVPAETAPEDVTMNEDGDIEVVKESSPSLTNQLRAQFVQLKLRPIVHLMKLAKKKRSCLVYLCDELQSVLDSLVKMKKKTIPMLAARVSLATTQVDKLYHGDSVTIWFCIKKAVEQVWSVVDQVFDFFSTLPDASQEVNAKIQKDLEDLGHKSLTLLHTILSGELYGSEEKMTAAEKREKRSVLVRIVEKKMNEAENLSNDADAARLIVAQYLVKVAEFAPTPAVAVAILDVFEDMKIHEDEEGDLTKAMAKYALAYLKKDWSKVDEIWSKGTKFTTAVRDILSHYIRLRRERDQLLAIQWILTNKVVQLVPEDDKRKSCVFSQHSDDDLLEKEDQKTVFYCITKSTFGVIFKTLFASLNACANRRDMSATGVKNLLVDEEESLAAWELASSCFLILCLLLRVNKIRTTAVLTTAVREGKQFLITVSKKSSFIYLMDNITKGRNNFDVISKKIEKILSAVQQGNRVLQSIGTYAKTNKCVLLLKKFPELRAESENCLRVIHSAMVKNECLNAFTVGLVKSRSIDGEIITEHRESSGDSDED